MIPYHEISSYLLLNALYYAQKWAPGGNVSGCEYTALNPIRNDKRKGNFRINIKTGKWADYADPNPKARGRDMISLYAYLNHLSNSQAARELSLVCRIYHDR